MALCAKIFFPYTKNIQSENLSLSYSVFFKLLIRLLIFSY